MRIFKTKLFAKWAKKESLGDDALLQVIQEMNVGLRGDELGGQIYKKRVALHSGGKRGGARTIIAYAVEGKAFFIYGFAKNRMENVGAVELQALKLQGKYLIESSDNDLIALLREGRLLEVIDNG